MGTGKAKAKLSLHETQSLFQEAILNQDDRILDFVLDNSRTGRGTLFGVYRDAYAGRLVDILAADYEFLKAYTGDDAFFEMARGYITGNPSHTQNARWFGARMAEFLAEDKRFASRRELSDLAAIETALANAFDAAEAKPVGIGDLAGIKPAAWGRLTFLPHPSVALFNVETNAFDIWCALKESAKPPPVIAKPGQQLIAWRQGRIPMIREIGSEEAMMWAEACRGLRFEVLCEMLATFNEPENAALRAAQYLQGWLSTEMLAGVSLRAKKRVGGAQNF